MPVFYFDTSALLKRYKLEKGTEIIAELLENSRADERYFTSSLTTIEMTSAVLRLARGGQLRSSSATQMLATFRRDLSATFRLWPLNDDIARMATSLVEVHPLKALDAIHLATTIAVVGAALPVQTIVVTSDREILQAATLSGVEALDPTDPLARAQLASLRA